MALGLALGSELTAAPTLATSLTVRELYDTNIFLQDDAPLAAGQTVAALPAQAEAWITNAALSLGCSWKQSPALQVDAAYAPELFRFSRHHRENHTDHRFTLAVAGQGTNNRYELKASWLDIVGSQESPIFNRLGGGPPVGSEPVRSRRSQDILKVSGRLTHPFKQGFVRGVMAVSAQDFHTFESTVSGYANYVDRSERSLGADLGWKLPGDIALVAGVRQGRQQQADLLGVSLNYTNTLTRWLVGAEGTWAKSLKFAFLAGPDIRRFGPAVRADFARHRAPTYLEGNATWTPNKTDSVTLAAKRYLTLSSGGRGVYIEGLYEVNWKRRVSPRWQVGAGLSKHDVEATAYNPTAPREDVVFGALANATCTLDPHTKLELGFLQEWSRSGIPNTPARGYHRQVFSLGCSRVW